MNRDGQTFRYSEGWNTFITFQLVPVLLKFLDVLLIRRFHFQGMARIPKTKEIHPIQRQSGKLSIDMSRIGPHSAAWAREHVSHPRVTCRPATLVCRHAKSLAALPVTHPLRSTTVIRASPNRNLSWDKHTAIRLQSSTHHRQSPVPDPSVLD